MNRYKLKKAKNYVDWLYDSLMDEAIANPRKKFSNLYDLLLDESLLLYAFNACRKKGGAHGIDRKTYKDIINDDLDGFILNIYIDLKKKCYRPDSLRRTYIRKDKNKKRAIDIPTIRDRVVQKAITILLTASFYQCSFAYRPDIGQNDALEYLLDCIYTKKLTSVFKADILKCFDNISRKAVNKALLEKIDDKDLIKIINSFFDVPIIDQGKRIRSTKGVHQGTITAPLLANLALHLVDRMWFKSINEIKYEAKYLRYADDILILSRYDNNQLEDILKKCIKPVSLELNPDKSEYINLRTGRSLYYLGYDIKIIKVSPLELLVRPKKNNITKLKNRLKKLVDEAENNSIKKSDLRTKFRTNINNFTNYYRLCNDPNVFDNINYYAEQLLRQKID